MLYFGVTKEELELARKIASDVLRTYGDFDDAGWYLFNTTGIWNDHAAVQAAIETIKHFKKPR